MRREVPPLVREHSRTLARRSCCGVAALGSRRAETAVSRDRDCGDEVGGLQGTNGRRAAAATSRGRTRCSVTGLDVFTKIGKVSLVIGRKGYGD